MSRRSRSVVRVRSKRQARAGAAPALLSIVLLVACDGGITEPRPIERGRIPDAPPPTVPMAASATPAVAPLAPTMAGLLSGAFSFRPPLPEQATSGAFDSGLLDVLTVDVCETGACGSTSIVEYTSATGQGAEVLRLDPVDEHFIVNWDTDAFALSASATYRVRVLALGLELGAVDVQVVKSGSELKNATGGTIALKDGRTLPVKFAVKRNRLVAAWVLAAQGGTAGDVAALLVGEFGSSTVETVAILDFAGYPAGDIVGWLRSALGQDLSGAAATLYQGGITAGDAGPGLRGVFGASLEDAARALHDAGYAVGDVAGWLLTEPDSPGSPAIIGLLRLAGYGLADVVGYLESTGVQGPQALGAVLLDAGFTFDDLGDWLIDDGVSTDAAAALLRGLGQTVEGAGDWLLGRGASEEETVAALRDAGYTAAETGDWLSDELGRTLEQAGLLLAGAGHAIADVGDWLFDRFDAIGGQPLEKATAILKKTGGAFDDVADWVFARVGGLDQTALEEAASILHDVGYAWMEAVGWLSDKSRRLHNTEDEIIEGVAGAGESGGWSAGDVADWIGSTYNRTLREVTGFLGGAGYVADDIGAALVRLGANATEIADALVARLGSSLEEVADLLKANGFNGEETFKAVYEAGRNVLSDPVDFALGVALAAVHGAGYFFDDFKHALTDGFVEWTNDVLVDQLGLSGYGLGDLVPFMIDVLGMTTQRVMEKVKAWGATLDEAVAALLETGARLQDIVNAAVSEFNSTVDHVTEVVVTTLVRLGASAQEIGETLVTELGTSLDKLAALLKANGFDGALVFEVLYRINRDVIGDPVGFSLNVALSVVEGVGYFFDDIKSALFGGIRDWTNDELLDGLHLSGFTMADIAEFAVGVMGLTVQRVLEKAKGWGVPVDEVIGGLLAGGAAIGEIVDQAVTVYNVTAAQLIAAMKANGQKVADFADALMTRFAGLTEDAATTLLRAAGYAANEVGDWLYARLASGGQVLEKVAKILSRAGYIFDDVAGWAWERSGHVLGAAVGALRYAGYTAHQVVDFFANHVHLATKVVFGALKNAGYAAADAAAAMIQTGVATMAEVGGWLNEFYSLSLESTLDILDSLGATLTDLIRVLIDVYSGTLLQATTLIIKYGYQVQEIIDNFV